MLLIRILDGKIQIQDPRQKNPDPPDPRQKNPDTQQWFILSNS
jgi:hypothetical protein